MKKVFFIVLIILTGSCGTKKKISESTTSEYNFKSLKDTLANTEVNTKIDYSSAEYLRKMFLNMNIEYEGAAGDSIVITQYGPAGEKLFETKVKGKGKAKFSSGSSSEDKRVVENLTKKNDSLFSASSNQDDSISSENSRESNVKIKSGPPIWFMALMLFILLLIFFAWKNRKKLKSILHLN